MELAAMHTRGAGFMGQNLVSGCGNRHGVLARHFYFMPNIPGMKYGEDIFLGDKLNTKK